MKKQITMLIILIILNSTLFAKQLVSWGNSLKNSDTIIIGKSLSTCSYCSEKNVARFKMVKVFRGDGVADEITVVADNLSFEKGSDYILFLNRKNKKYNWVEGYSPRPIANEYNRSKLMRLLEINRTISK